MTAVDVLDELAALGITATAAGQKLFLTPGSKVPQELLAEVKTHKNELLELVTAPKSIDLPFPIGYGGLPAEEVAKAEFQNDRLGITDPVDRKLNVLIWFWCHYRDRGQADMMGQMKCAYWELRSADPSIQRLVSIDGQSLDGLLQRLRKGHEWLAKEPGLWLEASPEAAADRSYVKALAAWGELEEDARQEHCYQGCIWGEGEQCPSSGPIFCQACLRKLC